MGEAALLLACRQAIRDVLDPFKVKSAAFTHVAPQRLSAAAALEGDLSRQLSNARAYDRAT
jgi:hypothetical protein